MPWRQIDFFKQLLTVGKSKTAEGTGRTVRLNSGEGAHRASNVVQRTWVPRVTIISCLPRGAHQRYDAIQPVTSVEKAWKRLRREAKVSARFHDLRHTRIPKLAETGAGDETIMGIAGHVSRRMLSRYAHIRTEAKRQALESIVRRVEVIPPVQAG